MNFLCITTAGRSDNRFFANAQNDKGQALRTGTVLLCEVATGVQCNTKGSWAVGTLVLV